MMLVRTLAAVTALALPGLALAAQETRTVAPFSAVAFSGKGQIAITVGKEQSLTLDDDAAALREVTTEVRGGTLEIKRREQPRGWSFFSFLEWLGSSAAARDDHLTVTIAVPRLTAVSVAGTARVHADGFDGGDTAFTIAGAGQIDGRGRLDGLALTIVGAGEAKLGDLVVTTANVSITGAGSVVVQPRQALDAQISGAGSVKYIGDPPTVTRTVSGMGRIERQ